MFSSEDGGKTFTLCIDENYVGCNEEGRGERLFDAEGEMTRYTASVLEFLKEYQAQFQRTQAFCKKLKELNLLESMRAQIKLNTGQQMGLTGFMAVSRDRLKALPAETLSELVKADELELIYLHLQSMRNLNAMVDRVARQNASKPDEEQVQENASTES